jgi:tetratricopeptide (TPR) repeat protein
MFLVSGYRRVAMLCLALSLAACDSPEERAAKHLARGEALLDQGQAEKARLEFRNALQLEPENIDARLQMARLFEAEGDLQRAVNNYQRVAESDRENVEARTKLGLIYLAAGELVEAQRNTEEAIALAAEDPEALAAHSAVQYRLGNKAAARQSARKALAIDQNNISANLIMITSRADDGDLDGALDEVDILLDRIGDEPSLHIMKLRLLAVRQDDAAIEAQLIRMTEVYPDQAQYRDALIRMYMTRGDLEAAEDQLRQAASGADAGPERRLAVAQFLLQTAGSDAARAELQRLIAESGAEEAVTYQLALSDLEVSQGDGEAARRILEEVIKGDVSQTAANRAIIQMARLDYSTGNRDAALAGANAVLENDEENVDALMVRAAIAIDRYEPQEAISDLRRALAAEPRNVDVLLLEARAQERNGNPTLVGERLASATRIADFRPDIAMLYVRHLLSREQESAAESVLAESARRNPRNRMVLTALAELRLRLNNLVGAEQVAETLRSLGDAEDAADQVMASILSQTGRVEESIDILEQVTAEDEENFGALATLVSSYVQTGASEKAVEFLEDIIERNPANIRALILRAELYLLTNEPAKAEAMLQRVVEAAPDEAIGYTVLNRFYTQTGNLVNAEAILQQGVDRIASSAGQGLRLALANLLEVKGDIDGAIAEYETLYELNPESLIVSNNLVSLLAEFRENDAEAIAFAKRVARRLRGSTVPHFLDTYGWVQFLAGDYQEALRSLRPAAEGLPNNPLVRYHVGRAYAALGQVEDARGHLEASLAIDPAFPKAASARAALAELGSGGG